MAYKKFDDPVVKVDDTKYGVDDVFFDARIRRAIQAISNVCLGTTSGTGHIPTLATCALGGSAGFKTTYDVGVVIDGVLSTCAATDNMLFEELGTMGTNTVAKFLICTKDGTSGTCIGPGNIINKEDYASATLAAAAAKIPDLPDGAAPLGYVTLQAPAVTKLILTGGASTTAAKLGYVLGTGGTAGTATYVDLMRMPYDK
jgi:hypothetical protein